jgi:hypothetical protein
VAALSINFEAARGFSPLGAVRSADAANRIAGGDYFLFDRPSTDPLHIGITLH